MKYALLLMGRTEDPECGETGGADPSEFMAFDEKITEAGIVVGGFALEGPEFGIRVSESEGEPIVTSGPFAESNEFVGGSYVIDVDSVDEAIAWAKMSPGAKTGHIEIRPVADY
ncbi:YciI family protein [Brevibacterium renqingii]|uniref:YciI family protein n=1 Tax=Brevibacterium renqingii TaxID=2776916 RepID=UPI001AE0B00F|nr:YciI family protein [Brevibacterium renqingii]